ncbi:ABC transporter permease [Phaeodactylibacter luteus]|uniref:Transport permease protein n=1 Tax=Phaeodactylibacter luteus TaxID=1564516 RepID=A0A5C6RN65_9BACT|nr:ABC transporter permease [Phaeodactylibacter luteus]TXB63791.1 ABC transporter permease [Phaeodactylibacter luteus]
MQPQNNKYTLVIEPKRSLLDLNLKEVWQYRDLILLFVRRDLVARFKQTILGPAWFLLGPLLSTLVYTLVFNRIAQISTDGAPPMLFYLTGIVGWNYFAACLNGTSSTFTANASIFGKVYFPRLVTPISTVISNLVQFFIQMLLLFVVMLIFWQRGASFQLNLTALLIPVYLVILAAIGLGVGIIISSLTTKYRDLIQLMGFGVQLWMYATPVIYPVSTVPEKYRFVVLLNPIAPIVENFKYGLLGSGSFNLTGLLYAAGFALVFLFLGIVLFNRVEKTFMDTV